MEDPASFGPSGEAIDADAAMQPEVGPTSSFARKSGRPKWPLVIVGALATALVAVALVVALTSSRSTASGSRSTASDNVAGTDLPCPGSDCTGSTRQELWDGWVTYAKQTCQPIPQTVEDVKKLDRYLNDHYGESMCAGTAPGATTQPTHSPQAPSKPATPSAPRSPAPANGQNSAVVCQTPPDLAPSDVYPDGSVSAGSVRAIPQPVCQRVPVQG
jgi:hypothetical protein